MGIPTMKEAKEEKQVLERKILHLLTSFENFYGVSITGLDLRCTTEMGQRGSRLTELKINAKL